MSRVPGINGMVMLFDMFEPLDLHDPPNPLDLVVVEVEVQNKVRSDSQ